MRIITNMFKKNVKPSIELVDFVRIRGNVKATLFRGGNFERPIVVYDDRNTLSAGALNYLGGALVKTVTNAIDAPFTSVAAPAAGYDGIIVSVANTFYSMKCTGTPDNGSYVLDWTGSGASRKFTGELTGKTGAVITPILGHDWQTPFTHQWATPGSWPALTLAATGDYLYIEWTITIA